MGRTLIETGGKSGGHVISTVTGVLVSNVDRARREPVTTISYLSPSRTVSALDSPSSCPLAELAAVVCACAECAMHAAITIKLGFNSLRAIRL